MSDHRLISDAEIARTAPTEAQLAAAIANVVARCDADFAAAAETVGRKLHEATP